MPDERGFGVREKAERKQVELRLGWTGREQALCRGPECRKRPRTEGSQRREGFGAGRRQRAS